MMAMLFAQRVILGKTEFDKVPNKLKTQVADILINECGLPEPVEPPPTTEERVAALEAENKLLKEQVSAQADQAEFYEDCIAEMATVVYA